MKSAFKSRTLWFNVLTLIPLLFDAVAGNLGLFQAIVSPKWWPVVMVVITIGNIWLRIITTQALGKPKE